MVTEKCNKQIVQHLIFHYTTVCKNDSVAALQI